VQDPGPGEVRVQMVAGGVCHSDLHVMTGHLNAPLPAIPAPSWPRIDAGLHRQGALRQARHRR
jgi:NADPH:quinone reductase-like Zn-dependent oxidoreductase